MKVHLTRTLWVDNKIYPAGPQEVPEQILKGRTFATFIKAGYVVDPVTIRKTAVKSVAERAESLLEKLHSKNMKDATPEQAESLKGGVKSESENEAGGDSAPDSDSAPTFPSKPPKKK